MDTFKIGDRVIYHRNHFINGEQVPDSHCEIIAVVVGYTKKRVRLSVGLVNGRLVEVTAAPHNLILLQSREEKLFGGAA